MLFKLSSPLASSSSRLKVQFEALTNALAHALPDDVAYGRADILRLLQISEDDCEKVLESAVRCGLLEKLTYRQDPVTGFDALDEFDDDTSNYTVFEKYEVVAQLMKLIDDLKNTTDAVPYFISFYTGEGRKDATALHSELAAAGIPGFFSDELQSGVQFRQEIIQGLQSAGTAFLFESKGYHTRHRCEVERDFCVARGLRVIRVGMCELKELQHAPSWLNDIQFKNFVQAGAVNLNHNLLGIDLPMHIGLDLRKRAAITLVDRLTLPAVQALAAKLDLQDELAGPLATQRTMLCNSSFLSPTMADRFCSELIPLAQF